MPARTAPIASKNQDILHKPRTVFVASLMIPNRAKIKKKIKETLEPFPQGASSAFTFSRSVHFDTAIVTPPFNSIIALGNR